MIRSPDYLQAILHCSWFRMSLLKQSGVVGAPIMSDPEIAAIASKNGVSPAIILISHHVSKGTVVLPKSVSEERMTENRKVIKISAEDLEKLDALVANGKAKRINTPLWGWNLGFDDWYGPKN
ncbi:uncharacterized protein L199_001203 [Kwoniella botswanensis]|uniref:uncharacterized protein n=1 Tax=Kwoniella botswanensis TaxID=1268659 RepID=UPI00315C76E5